MRHLSKSPLETEALGTKLAKKLRTGGVLALEGDLGGGKTVLVKGLAKGLGIKSSVISPTFTIYRTYEVPGSKKHLHHFDLYRLEAPDHEIIEEMNEHIAAGDIVAIEWAEKVRDFLPKKITHLKFHVLAPGERAIEVINR